jgi:hypothetical protein
MQARFRIRMVVCTRMALLCVIALAAILSPTRAPAVSAQSTIDATSPDASLPEPIYWKQTLFLIPYQFSSASDPAAAQAVWLLVSKDLGATWQKISEAKPHVKSFNYRAEGDGEYWFAIRTLDRQGHPWPEGDYQPELRVIVDTTMPRIEALRGQTRPDGAIDIWWHGSDTNLDADTWKIEAQSEIDSAWQPIPIPAPTAADQIAGITSAVRPPPAGGHVAQNGMNSGGTTWQPPPGPRPMRIRASITDRAGNTATYCAPIEAAPLNESTTVKRLPGVVLPSETPRFPTTSDVAAPAGAPNNESPTLSAVTSAAPGWISSGASPAVGVSPPSPPAEQIWQPTFVARAPFRLSTSGAFESDDGVTAYGNPNGVGVPAAGQTNVAHDQSGVSARYATAGDANAGLTVDGPPPNTGDAPFHPVPPYREAFSWPSPGAEFDAPADTSNVPIDPNFATNSPPTNSQIAAPAADVRAKMVGSRTFALEYDLEQVGRSGISTIELWGTRDGGQSWSCYALDDDNRSPLIVTVDDEGLYGFRIVAQSADAVAAPPTSGEVPELWVAVDLQRPIAELTAIQQGIGNMNDHLVLQWRAGDDNLEPRPISLFYSSRPAGPWSAIATSLANTGQYAWRVERHVPTRFYVRLEARDTAGNLAAFQTRDAVEFVVPSTNVRLRSAEPIAPTAAGNGDAYR